MQHIQNLIKTSEFKNLQSLSFILQNELEKVSDAALKENLTLLSNASSMMLNSKSKSEPFSPFIIMSGRRSTILDDFVDADYVKFEEIFEYIDDYKLKARIADILWSGKKKFNYVPLAIDHYVMHPLDRDALYEDAYDAWARATFLAKSIGKPGHVPLQHIQDNLYDTFVSCDEFDDFYIIRLAELLYDSGLDETRRNDVAEQLESIAFEAISHANWHLARGCIEEAIRWYKSLDNEIKEISLTNELATTWSHEAEMTFSSGNYHGAGVFFDNAMKVYRSIPRQHRELFDIDTKLHTLHKHLNESNALSLGNMKAIKTTPIDIGQLVEASINYVKEKSYPDVIGYLSHVTSTERYRHIKESANKSLAKGIFRQLTSTVLLTSDGRVAARSSAINPLDPNDPAKNEALSSEMAMHFSIGVGLSVESRILPALQQVLMEHRITEKMLLDLCKQSVIVPVGRERFWSKGLFFGFEGDFASALHMLSPQLEHIVRIGLKENGVKTSTIDTAGIETENGLSTLLDKDEAKDIFEEDFVFEMKMLMTSQYGPNLRNVVAHGLIGDEEASSQYSVYLWWRMLRLMMDSILIEVEEEIVLSDQVNDDHLDIEDSK